jgi:DDE family transposase
VHGAGAPWPGLPRLRLSAGAGPGVSARLSLNEARLAHAGPPGDPTDSARLIRHVGRPPAPALGVHARLADNDYADKIEITDQQLAAVNLTRDTFHGEWNYTIKPSP